MDTTTNRVKRSEFLGLIIPSRFLPLRIQCV